MDPFRHSFAQEEEFPRRVSLLERPLRQRVGLAIATGAIWVGLWLGLERLRENGVHGATIFVLGPLLVVPILASLSATWKDLARLVVAAYAGSLLVGFVLLPFVFTNDLSDASVWAMWWRVVSIQWVPLALIAAIANAALQRWGPRRTGRV